MVTYFTQDSRKGKPFPDYLKRFGVVSFRNQGRILARINVERAGMKALH
jgi:hypothetical protein